MSAELVLGLSNGKEFRVHRGHPLTIDGNRVGFLAPFTSRWVFYPLVNHPIPYRNQKPIRGACELHEGDELRIGKLKIAVQSISVSQPESPLPTLTNDPPLCWLQIQIGDDEPFEESVTYGKAILGTHADCDIRFEESSGLTALHTLLCYADDQWHLFDLSGAKFLTQEGFQERYLMLTDGDQFTVEQIHISFRCSALMSRLEGLETERASDTRPHVAIEGDEANGSENEPAMEPGPLYSLDSSSDMDFRGHFATSNRRSDPLYERATRLCQWLQAMLRGDEPSTNPASFLGTKSATLGSIGSFVRSISGSEDPEADLDRLCHSLVNQPRNRDRLFELARFYNNRGYMDLSRWTLKELVRLYPKDIDTLRTLVKLYLIEAQRKDRNPNLRLSDYERAEKYVAKAVQLSANAGEDVDLQRTIAAEITMLRSKLEPRR